MSDILLAISEQTTQDIFSSMEKSFHVSNSKTQKFGLLTLGYSAGIKIENGKVAYNGDGTISIKEVDIVLDPFRFNVGIDLPTVTVGGQCLIKILGKCRLRLPKITVFGGDPDVSVSLDLTRLVRFEFSGRFKLETKHFINPAGAGLTPWKAYELDALNEWQIFLSDPSEVDFDYFDLGGVLEDKLKSISQLLVDRAFGFLPGWAKSIVNKIIGGIAKFIERILDLPDDVLEWLSRMLGVSLGLSNFILEQVLKYLLDLAPIFSVSEPYAAMQPEAKVGSYRLVPVLLPIGDFQIQASATELTLTVDWGP